MKPIGHSRWLWCLFALVVIDCIGIAMRVHSYDDNLRQLNNGVDRTVMVPAAAVFQTDILPILSAKCLDCHGANPRIKPKAFLDLRTVAGMVKGGSEGPALVPGNLEKSLLFTEIDGPQPSMPPKGEPKLTAAEKKKIADWIKGGASER